MNITTKMEPERTSPASLGLTAAVPFVLSGQLEEYLSLRDGLQDSVQPEGALEHVFFSRLVHAAWTLHRCDLAESTFAQAGDPLTSTDPATFQHAVALDRFRSRAERTLYRCTKELRLLQQERSTRDLTAATTYPVPAEVVDAIPPMAPSAEVIKRSHPPTIEATLQAQRRADDRQLAAHFTHRLAQKAAASQQSTGMNEAKVFAARGSASHGR